MKGNVDTKGNKFLWSDNHRIQFRKGKITMYFRMKCYGESAFRKVHMAKRGTSLQHLKAHTLLSCSVILLS